MKALLLLLLACTLTPSAVFGHGYIVNPEMTWVVNPFYDKNAPAAFYDASSTFGRNPLDIYPNLRYVVDRDTPYTNIPVIAANANKKCGMTSATGPTRSISGSFRFDVDPAALHEGPCEVWVDDVRTMVARSCKTTYTGRPWTIPVDIAQCTRPTCVVQFIWIGTHNPTYEVFKNCFPIASGATTTQAPSGGGGVVCSQVAPYGGSCGASNGGVYCPGSQCCSQYGYCGVGSPWCDNNPNSIYNGGSCA
ncbi:hypothetical protein PC111_g14055 [Phytophthora cactorum]|nr:hypothetical protein PC111_g14055 [Phytophthora cactorum]